MERRNGALTFLLLPDEYRRIHDALMLLHEHAVDQDRVDYGALIEELNRQAAAYLTPTDDPEGDG
jgi:hypothetical protein